MATAYAPSSDADRAPGIPEPSTQPITYRGRDVTPGMILDLWQQAMHQKQESRKRILQCREYRRMTETTLVQLSPRWRRMHPEADWVVEALEERVTLDANMVARVGVVEPEFSVAPIATEDLDPFTKTAHELAEEREAYLEEWRQRNVPVQAFFGKGTEDGEYARVTLPIDVDREGCPEFFETLDERAYRKLPPDEQKGYVKDEPRPGRKRARYVKTDASGARVVATAYRARPESGAEKNLPSTEREKAREKRAKEEKDRHLADVRRYLLDKQASVTRIIPALDCAPIFTRGRGSERWELSALVERTLYWINELQEQEFAWQGMGDRAWVPIAYSADGTRMSVPPGDIGQNGQVYLYTAYLVCKDAEGHARPIIAYTVGGASTTYGLGDTDPGDTEQVGLIDLYEEYLSTDEDGREHSIEGPLWSYHGGLHTEDDDPDHYWHPYLWTFLRRIRGLEGNKSSMNAATHVGSFPGQYFRPDAQIAALEGADEFLFEDDGQTLRRPKIARSGELEPAVGEIFNAPPPGIGQDAWRQYMADMEALRAATAVDQPPPSSGSGAAQLVQTTIGQVAKRHIREGALAAVVRSGEDHLRILDAIYHRDGIKWPIQTVDERPFGDETRTGVRVAEYDPRWIGEGNFNLRAEYPEEGNLAMIDLEASLADRGYGSTERVYKALGEKDSARARFNADKDRLSKHPAIDALRVARVAKRVGDREMAAIVALQAQGEMSKAEIPGLPGGIPTEALKRQGEPSGAGGPSIASSQRGGITAGAYAGATAAADAGATMTQMNPQMG